MKLNYKNNNHVIEEVEREGVFFLKFPMLEDTGLVSHGFSTRIGGVSRNEFSTMNLSSSRGDDPGLVMENYRRISHAIGVDIDKMISSHQTHTNHVRVVDERLAGNGIISANELEDVDGLVTNVPGLCLTTFYADCVPLYFLDPVRQVIGLSHSGWKGTVARIGKVTIETMQKEYNCDPANILVAIGPSICQNCYEVSEDVINEFRTEFHEKHWGELFYKKSNDKYQLDLWKANEIIMLESGISIEHIAVTNICTCCNSDVLFSHRASKGKRGNLAAFLALKERN